MIKINLLPPNIFEARAVKRLMIVFAVAALVVIAAFAGWTIKVKKDASDMQAKYEYANKLKTQADGWKSKADSERAKIGPTLQKVNFFEAVKAHNEKFPELYEELAAFTYKRVFYTQVTPAPGMLTMQAYVPSLAEAGRYLLNLYKATHLFSRVMISAVPGYPYQGAPPPSSATGTPGLGMGGPGMMSPAMSMPGGGGMLPPPMARPSAGLTPPGGGFGAGAGALSPPTAGGSAYGSPYSGLGAISSTVGRLEQGKLKGFMLTVQCVLTPDWAMALLAPSPVGAVTVAQAGGAPPGMGMGMPGMVPGMGVPGAAPGTLQPPGGGTVAAPTRSAPAPAAPAGGAKSEETEPTRLGLGRGRGAAE